VLSAVVLKSFVFWDITPCSPLKISRTRARYLLYAAFLLGLIFGPKDGSDIFLRNVNSLLTKLFLLGLVQDRVNGSLLLRRG
jgi:hypothetical protein